MLSSRVKFRGLVFLGLLTICSQPVGATEASKQIERRESTKLVDVRFEYSAKIVCGTQPDPSDLILVRGVYATAINIRNPNRQIAEFEKSLALTFPPDEQKAGEVKPISIDRLGPGEALAVDCVDIKVRLFPYGFPRSLIEGFVVIRSMHSLDVTAVYTAAGLETKTCCNERCCDNSCCGAKPPQQTSIDVEQVRERTIGPPDADKLPDLVPSSPHPPGDPVGLPGTGYCIKPAAGQFSREIQVLVRNIGDEGASQSSTNVTFNPGGESKRSTPPLATGEDTLLNFAIPSACISSAACKFKIVVDSDLALTEAHETNNTDYGLCQMRQQPQ